MLFILRFILLLLAAFLLGACRKPPETPASDAASADRSTTRSTARPPREAPRLNFPSSGIAAIPPDILARASTDFAGALDLAKTLPRGERSAAVEALLRSMLESRPEWVSRELPTSGLPYSTRMEISRDLVKSWPDPQKALHWADTTLTGIARGRVLAEALARLIVTSPDSATTFMDRMPAGKVRDEAFNRMMVAWEQVDLPAALRYAQSTPDDPAAVQHVEWIYGMMAQREPAAAEAILRESPGDERLGMMAALLAVGRAREEGPAAAIAWAVDLPGLPGQRARKSALTEWAKTAPEAAAAYLDAASAELHSELAPVLATEWSKRDPAAAGKWSESR